MYKIRIVDTKTTQEYRSRQVENATVKDTGVLVARHNGKLKHYSPEYWVSAEQIR